MANVFYVSDEHRAERVRALFARIASRYDLINDLQSFGLHRCWKAQLVNLAHPQPGERALDVCCGTGDLSVGLARRGAQVVGVDFTPQMLQIAARRRKILDSKSKVPSSKPQGNRPQAAAQNPESAVREWLVELNRADAQRLPFRDNTFDIVIVGYGLRNLADWGTGLSEMHRVARPGGRLLVLDFGKPDHPFWRWVYFGYLRLFVPVLGRVFCGDAQAYGYILESLKHYPAQKGVAAKMRELGLSKVRIINLLGGAMSINFAEKAVKWIK
jgi:demethylmenaquinone methyltransferase/2-methoxy-6-polyprenyl-1,4-benzoquinol methylase